MNRLNILVLAGGPSAEREVSLMGGKSVAESLRRLGHRVTLVDIRPEDLSALDAPGIDVVFPVLHGTWGEDGQLQAILDRRGLAYPGSGPEASALAMDKAASKTAFQAAGLSTPAWQVVSAWSDAIAATELPAVVKPIDQGSSVDLTIARDPVPLRKAVESVCAAYGRCMIEQFAKGREMTVGVLDQAALPPIEIVVHGHEFYDYQAKYFDDSTEYRVEPPIPAAVRTELQRQSLAAHRALGCRDFSRVDFILQDDGRPAILEVNTIPGFTSHSLLPKAAAHMGLDFGALCQRLVELAMSRSATAKGTGVRKRAAC
ncbi:MAG: D-alanine--D-alanine ligase [Phycisphaerae bacterium]|nr:D-alanine--D-alanine ligase [Phycisphaerae bacterium]